MRLIVIYLALATSPVLAQTPPTAGGTAPPVLPPTTDGFENGKTPFAGAPSNAATSTPFGCAPGPTQAQCLATVKRMQPGQQKKKKDGMEQAMPILNAISSALGGGGSPEPADGGRERMAAGADSSSGGSGGGGGYSSSRSTTFAKDLKANSEKGYAAIVPVFQKYFDPCTQKLGLGICSFRNDGIWGDADHMKRKSCHNNGTAIDVGLPLTCQGSRQINRGESEAVALAHCLAENSNNELRVIFQVPNGTKDGWTNITGPNMFTSRYDHRDHLHVQLPGCGH